MSARFDVIVLGEVLVELSSEGPFHHGREVRLSFSGDALNAAGAAARAGASVALVTRVAEDELGEALLERVEELGVSTELVQRVPGQQGVYFAARDPDGAREFVYVRRGSAASGLGPEDLPLAELEGARVLLTSGVACAISESCAAAVERAVSVVGEAGGAVVYDPNFRGRLTSPDAAADALRRLAPAADLVTPSCPADTTALLGTGDAEIAARACLDLGTKAALITCGAVGAVLDRGAGPVRIPPASAPRLVDATGAGDVMAGTVAARLALGDDLELAAHLGASAAALSLGGAGGTGHLPTWEATRGNLVRS